MKTKLLTFAILMVSCLLAAQNAINYKALIKDNQGNVLEKQSVTVQFTILEGSEMKTVYQEDHITTTDENGIVILNIGLGSVLFGDYIRIDWGISDHFLNVQIDTGSGLVDLGTTQFMAVPYAHHAKTSTTATNVTGLEAIDEGNGMGWRLKGRDPLNFANIGENAIDFSTQNFVSDIRGATGPQSVAFGVGTEASGANSFAMGTDSTAEGHNAVVFGTFNEAIGNYATAFGFRNTASAFHSFAIGRYSIGGGNPTVWNGNDPLFEVGNGTSTINRNNALTIYKTGYHVVDSDVSGLMINSANTGLIVNNSGSTGILINEGSNYGLVINGAQQDGIVVSDVQDDGIVVSAQDEGAIIIGGSVGVYARTTIVGNPDIILGGTLDGTNEGDDGIIASDPNFAGSDIYLRSNDAIVMELDNDNSAPDSDFIIRNGTASNVFTVAESGNTTITGILQIGTETIEDTGSNILEFDASLVPTFDTQFLLGTTTNRWNAVYATNGIINTSDKREKKNIETLAYGLSEVLKMKPVSFNWKNSNNPDTKLGLIAQDVQKLIPEVVKSHVWETDESTGLLTKKEIERLGVYYSDLIPVLINAIQEQQVIIESQKLLLEAQEQASIEQSQVLQTLLKRVETLEKQSKNIPQIELAKN